MTDVLQKKDVFLRETVEQRVFIEGRVVEKACEKSVACHSLDGVRHIIDASATASMVTIFFSHLFEKKAVGDALFL